MIVVAMASTKGGVGKTTLTASLAACAASEGKQVVLVDLDPQETLAMWWKLRGCPDNPKLVAGYSTAQEAIEALSAKSGADWVFIDGPPGFISSIEEMIEVADFVVIPTKTAMLDIVGSESAVTVANNLERPYLIVLGDVHKDGTEISAAEFLEKHNLPIAQTRIPHRVAHVRAISAGKTALDVDNGRHRDAIKELQALWEEIRRMAVNAAKKRKRSAA